MEPNEALCVPATHSFSVKKNKVKYVLLYADLKMFILWAMGQIRYRIPYVEIIFFLDPQDEEWP